MGLYRHSGADRSGLPQSIQEPEASRGSRLGVWGSLLNLSLKTKDFGCNK